MTESTASELLAARDLLCNHGAVRPLEVAFFTATRWHHHLIPGKFKHCGFLTGGSLFDYSYGLYRIMPADNIEIAARITINTHAQTSRILGPWAAYHDHGRCAWNTAAPLFRTCVSVIRDGLRDQATMSFHDLGGEHRWVGHGNLLPPNRTPTSLYRRLYAAARYYEIPQEHLNGKPLP